jgi:HAMP domain-containing protein/signal transduction histidine kinase/CheY-like chemotaxis protein
MATTMRARTAASRPRRSGPEQRTAGKNGAALVSVAELQELLEALRLARRGVRGVRVDARKAGILGELGKAFNALAQTREKTTDEIVRVATVIGREGRLTARLRTGRAEGTWREQLDAVNAVIDDLARPTTEVARVIEAVADGDLSQRIQLKIEGRPLKGEFLRISKTVNAMVDQLSSFASEVTRVAREVGTEGKLGGQARVRGVSGTWKDLTDNVNQMASNLTAQVRNIAAVTTAVANGDLTKKITVDVKGEVLELKNTINTMVDQLSSFADEVTRVAREAGSEGKLGGQAVVKGVSGTWKDLTDNVNFMVSNLTTQVRGIANVVTAVADGDLNRKFTIEAKGEVAALADTINTMVDQLSSFADEVTRVAREVGTEGILGGQATVKGVSGTWKDLTDNVNFMASNLTTQVRGIARVVTAVADGDLERKFTIEARGEVAALADTINAMIDALRTFADEVTRVAREVGVEGRLGGAAQVEGVSGVWRRLTDNVNLMVRNLTEQVRGTAEVTTAVARGDLSQKIDVDAVGEFLELKNTINTMVDQLSSFADEVTRVAREVGTEGQLGGQAQVEGVSGVWRGLTENVNRMANNLTTQVRNIAEVTTGVANGDLSRKITVPAKGEVAELADTINEMIDRLNAFAAEVTRVAREVGTEGKLGGQANVEGVSGVWRGLTENVNTLADNLSNQVRNIADVTTAVANGDLSRKITVAAAGEIAELKNTINTMVDQLSSFAAEVTRVAREVGTEGKLGGQADVRGVSGTWKDLTDSVNSMAQNLTTQVRNIAEVTTAVANGDLSRKITVAASGEVAALAETINRMVDQLSSFAAEVTRVAREVGTEGRLGGQADVQGVSGTWKDLTDSVNNMANNLTTQVRNIADVTTAVAEGDLSKKITVDVRGEVLELKNTINTMVDQLSSFAAEVTRVAREVGTEGKLGGQANVEGVSGVWKDLTDNVNRLARTLTQQLRAIADVSTAVTQGDLTRAIAVEARGEVEELKNNINQMITNLRETTEVNANQAWLNTNMARISGMLQGQRDLKQVSQLIMSELTPLVGAQHGAFFMVENGLDPSLRLIAGYGFKQRTRAKTAFAFGETLVGQAAVERKSILLTQAPSDYISISSGLGEAAPTNVIVLPILFEDRVLAVVEIASFQPFSDTHLLFLEQVSETIGVVLNTIVATMRTEELLQQSQSLTQELQSQSVELQTQRDELERTNQELEEKAQLLAKQNARIEQKNAEVEAARLELEEKAEQLALSSKYKSEFLANMSHELRTPLNSLLILAKLLADNEEGTLTEKQVEFARTIYNAGSDLLELINDILDLSKVEAGKMDVHPIDLEPAAIADYVERSFRPIADQKGLTFEIELARGLPEQLHVDEQRLQQILKNLLANAFKFTERGGVKLTIEPARPGIRFYSSALAAAGKVIAFSVADTGIGIPEDKLRLIFEAFQQADGTTSRKFGGTGLGLSISREIGQLLGGEITAESEAGTGSTFTLYLPARSPAKPDVVADDVDPTALAQHDVERDRLRIARRSAERRRLLEPVHVAHAAFSGKKVLLADDDARSAFALASVLEQNGVEVLFAENGREVLQTLHANPEVDLVLMDVMMPELDGYEAMRLIRAEERFARLPIVSLTAKAMQGDREKSMESGASDYLTKPVDPEQVLSRLHVWLHA